MILVGEAKQAFESYFTAMYDGDKFPALKEETDLLGAFQQVPLSMQCGVYLEWFDSVGIKIVIMLDHDMKFTYYINGEQSTSEKGYDHRSSARIAALGRAVYIFNRRGETKKSEGKTRR